MTSVYNYHLFRNNLILSGLSPKDAGGMPGCTFRPKRINRKMITAAGEALKFFLYPSRPLWFSFLPQRTQSRHKAR